MSSPSLRAISGMEALERESLVVAVSPSFLRSARILRRNSFHLVVRSRWRESCTSVSWFRSSLTGSTSLAAGEVWFGVLPPGFAISALPAVTVDAEGSGLTLIEGREPLASPKLGFLLKGLD